MKGYKEALIEWISSLPNDVQIFIAPSNTYDCVDLKIFLTHKDKEFLKWYFGL